MTILTVDTDRYVEASSYASAAGADTSAAARRTSLELLGATGMAGWDSSGADWASAYDPIAGQVLVATGELALACSDTARALSASAGNYIRAELVASHGAAALITPFMPVSVDELCMPGLPSAAAVHPGMSPPFGWDVVAGLVGAVWPNADTAALRGASGAWTSLANSLESTRTGPLAQIRSSIEGLAAWELRLLEERSIATDSSAAELTDAARQLGTACDTYAASVDEAHAELVAETAAFVSECAAVAAISAGLSFVTLGGAAGIGALVTGARIGLLVARVGDILGRLAAMALRAKVLVQAVPGVGRLTGQFLSLGVKGVSRAPALGRVPALLRNTEGAALWMNLPGAGRLAPVITAGRPIATAAGKVLDSKLAALITSGPLKYLLNDAVYRTRRLAFGSLAVRGQTFDQLLSFAGATAAGGTTVFKSVKWLHAANSRKRTVEGMADVAVGVTNPTRAAGGKPAGPGTARVHVPGRLTGGLRSPLPRPTVAPSRAHQTALPAESR
ncbi:hypothetical protein [Arthrobacter sp. H5]|uniref:WXG100-like domain-containing protein n=1 Tax=Arthrobacter sp. H5 TaxID=1267973 RepID=UPI00048A1AB1|nr:hypothetical protein [Arthrobacter sp. H5]